MRTTQYPINTNDNTPTTKVTGAIYQPKRLKTNSANVENSANPNHATMTTKISSFIVAQRFRTIPITIPVIAAAQAIV